MEERLFAKILEGATPHALLIAGPAGSGKADLARRAAALYCLGDENTDMLHNCPNYTEMAGAETNIERVRALMASAAVKSFNGTRRAFVLLDAHRLDTRTQNALLKVLEEPPLDTMLILTGSEMGVLPTIRSRCMIRRVGASDPAEVAKRLTLEGVDPALAGNCARAADGVIGLAREYASESGAAFRKEAMQLLSRTLFGIAPFAAAAELVGEDTPKEGKKRRPDADKTGKLFAVWADVFRDALTKPYGSELRNPDAAALIDKISNCFTETRIQSNIETLMTAQQRLLYRASPTLTLDAALAKISLKEKV